jgi:DNA-binding MarR family transcriptional regulator
MPTATASHVELAARLRLAVTRLARRLRQQSGEGLTPSQTSALASIDRHGGLSPSDLAAVEQIRRPTATRILAGLIDAGLITREADTSDRRIARVRITPEGAATLKRGRSRKNAYLARRLEGLDEEEMRTLERAAALLERMTQDEEEQSR